MELGHFLNGLIRLDNVPFRIVHKIRIFMSSGMVFEFNNQRSLNEFVRAVTFPLFADGRMVRVEYIPNTRVLIKESQQEVSRLMKLCSS